MSPCECRPAAYLCWPCSRRLHQLAKDGHLEPILMLSREKRGLMIAELWWLCGCCGATHDATLYGLNCPYIYCDVEDSESFEGWEE